MSRRIKKTKRKIYFAFLSLEYSTDYFTYINLEKITLFLEGVLRMFRYVHTNIIARDSQKLIEFYKNALNCKSIGEKRDLSGEWLDKLTGLENAHLTGEHLCLPGYGAEKPTLEIFSYDDMIENGHSKINQCGVAHIAFEVEDVQASLKSVLEAGGSQIGEIVKAEYENGVKAVFVYATDLEGNIIELQSFDDNSAIKKTKKEVDDMPSINMLSSADLVKGQGVSSAYLEQVSLVSQGLKNRYDILVNSKRRCDIIHFHTLNPEYFITMNRAKKRSAFVGYVHFLPETVEESLGIPRAGKKLFYKYMIDFYNSMDYLVTVNPYFIGELVKYGIPKEKVTYIPNYVSEDSFYEYSSEHKAQLRREWEIPEDKFVVLGVGQVQTRKGVFDFVETAKELPEYFFIWAGGFSFGPMTEGYKELKQLMLDPPENVLFPGIIDRERMNDIYNISDVMFLPSFSELFPMTILESMCVNRPILLRDLEIYHDILFDYYLKGDSVADFAEQLKTLESNKDFYKKWSNKSLEGHLFYSKDNVLKLWEKFYDRVYEESSEKFAHAKKLTKKEKSKLKKEEKQLKKGTKSGKGRHIARAVKMKDKLFEDLLEERDRLIEEFREEKDRLMKRFLEDGEEKENKEDKENK